MANNERSLYGRGSNGRAPLQGTPKLDPFLNPRNNFLDPVIPADPRAVSKQFHAYDNPLPVLQPRHLEAPEGSRTINLLKIVSVPAGGTVTVFEFQCKPGSSVVFYTYELLSDALYASGVLEWLPKIDSRKLFTFHGVPNANGSARLLDATSIINLGYSPAPVKCQVLMEPGQILSWEIRNTSGAPILAGVRMSGYLDMNQRLSDAKFGD